MREIHMGKKPLWKAFESTGNYILVYLETGIKEKNVSIWQRSVKMDPQKVQD